MGTKVKVMQKKILIFSEAFGSGHTKAAEAIVQAISLQEPSVQTQIMEIGKRLHPIRSELIFSVYKKIITTCPYFWKIMYQTHRNEPIPDWLQLMIYQFFHRNMEKVLGQIKPDLVICTHPFSSSSLSRIKKMGYPIRMCTVITDFHVHRVWVQPEVDLYIVSNEEACLQLLHFGVAKHRIAVTGIPIQSNFWTKVNKQQAKEKLNLKNFPTVMVMGGGLGLGGIKDLVHSLIKWKESIQLLICTGYNDALRTTLSTNIQFQHPHIVIMGFVDIIDQLLDAADLLITKPGGLTCFEALSKGVPMLLYKPIPGHEEDNCNHLIQHELAVRIHHQQEADRWIEKLLFVPDAFEWLRENMNRFQQKLNPLAGARAVLELLDR